MAIEVSFSNQMATLCILWQGCSMSVFKNVKYCIRIDRKYWTFCLRGISLIYNICIIQSYRQCKIQLRDWTEVQCYTYVMSWIWCSGRISFQFASGWKSKSQLWTLEPYIARRQCLCRTNFTHLNPTMLLVLQSEVFLHIACLPEVRLQETQRRVFP